MRTPLIAPLSLGLAVTIAGCSWFGGGQNTAPGHIAPVTTDSQAGATITPTGAKTGTTAKSGSQVRLSNAQVRQAQEKLQQLGLYKGRVDGLYGPRTIAAVEKFQSDNKLPRTGELAGATEQRLQSAQANQQQNQPQTAQQPAPNNQSANPQTSAVPSNQSPTTGRNPNANPSSNAPNNQPAR